MKNSWLKWLPISSWLPDYSRHDATKDGLAAIIVTLMLIPQSLAYAMVAGLPPVVGLYASILPLIAYTLLGTSKTLAVGPVAVISLMTAEAVAPLFETGSQGYITAAATLAFLSGIVLLLMSVLRLGFLTTFLSHPVLSGFMTASGILISIGQFKHILGVPLHGENVIERLTNLILALPQTNFYSLLIGVSCLIALIYARKSLRPNLIKLGLSSELAGHVTKLAPVIVMILSIVLVALFDLDKKGVSVVGQIPSGLPSFSLPSLDLALIGELLPAAILLSIIGFVESASVGQTLAAKRRQRIEPNQELIALSGANIASAINGGFPVTGGLSRSVVNYDAGAETPLAGTFTAIGIGITVLYFTPLFTYLPHTVLAATIIVAVSALIDVKAIIHTWKSAKSDAIAMFLTIIGVLAFNVEIGLFAGLVASLVLFLWRTSRPHIAVVGLVHGTHYFRNVDRYEVETTPSVVTIRIDESLYFANSQYLEEKIPSFITHKPLTRHLILMFSGVNDVDLSALDSLKKIMSDLQERGITVHFSEIKGPVMDILNHTNFIQSITGHVYFDQYTAYHSLKCIEK
ncbi:SulP family sulfate permease [Vibrio sp. ES.051]|uniref:SulP family inorganic anion transporter n=1 Tax=Vibrio sp. ES.051 TaxID=1761909 RepID=UPI000BF5DF15|nr:sulfate permease [Vibrio sp. ES.051]PFG58007.1 SulP family sulfate permease [Vibrio sp. ES.051]